MSQNREPPAYQEYAAAMMAKLEYRTMTLQDRGLLDTMRRECWVNNSLPADQSKLAKMLGFDVAEIAASLPAVMPFFNSDGQQIFCPELVAYRAHLDAQRKCMSDGGKRSAEGKKKRSKTAEKPATPGDASTLPTTLQAPMQAPCKVLVKSSTAQPSQVQSPVEALGVDPFVAEYEVAEQRETSKRIEVEV
jgi:hypothetical protein